MKSAFDKTLWEKRGNHYWLKGTQIELYFWNSGKNANYLVEAGWRYSNSTSKSFYKGTEARDAAIAYALSIKDKYLI